MPLISMLLKVAKSQVPKWSKRGYGRGEELTTGDEEVKEERSSTTSFKHI